MRNRCNNPNNISYPYYGGRGIKVCRRWDKFKNFLADMGQPPSSKHTIERRNNDGNYTPSNCYWATRLVQSRNRPYHKLKPQIRTKIKWLYSQGHTQVFLAQLYGVSQGRISQVVRR